MGPVIGFHKTSAPIAKLSYMIDSNLHGKWKENSKENKILPMEEQPVIPIKRGYLTT
jgi:hypothetical protein